MPTIRRLTDSCLVVTTDHGATMLDPGFHTFGSGKIDLDSIGDIQRVLVTHEHGDHVSPEFVRWLIDRGDDLRVHSNQAVADLLAKHDIEVVVDDPPGVSSEDVLHEMTPLGTTPPNRAFTIEGVLTHPGDSYQPTETAPVLALPLLIPWGSTFQSMEFARRLAPHQVISIHDFYLSSAGREWISAMATNVLAKSHIEFVALDWGDSYTV
ncbi:MAG: MBL fold metallo-hydrolase [Acidimicrobiia bacterium]|nr:MBL fold metallo-hydrolase [Acidimicrobiia bacterium]MBT8193751.1 MBL fold metallo-hydrolase [Acidimicrobiia bacterium]NNF88775.1 MBL fold metallo-hydrolase [Acidimicrobiia bacterium]NNJ47736.1 MBL fold metallo-hydrolase [Acidimicrobiia bacterium]NNL14249.1 MBL fold metallo-hydrolase [Acidimicrobiia bacterium]